MRVGVTPRHEELFVAASNSLSEQRRSTTISRAERYARQGGHVGDAAVPAGRRPAQTRSGKIRSPSREASVRFGLRIFPLLGHAQRATRAGTAGRVIIEVKAVERFLPVHEAQLLTYLKLTGRPAGLLLNFNSTTLRNGLKRLDHPNVYAERRRIAAQRHG